MQIRFGYVAIALNLKESSTSKTITLRNLVKIQDPEHKISRLQRITQENLNNLLRVIRYNVDEKIHVYRLTSKLIPFATFPLELDWDYINLFADEFKTLGQLISSSSMRVSAHPDHFIVLNSPHEKVFEASAKDLEYHDNIFNAMGLNEEFKLVLHLGGYYGNKIESIKRFIYNFNRLPAKIRSRIVLENDDIIYTAEEVLKVCQEIKLPMVLDVHHHTCNPSLNLSEILPEIWDSWSKGAPKIHISSPKDQKHSRYHADYIEASNLIDFFNVAQQINKDFDVIVEAKMKDRAVFRLVEEVTKHSEVTLIDPTTIKVGGHP